MATPDTLLQLIAHLQGGIAVAHGRRILLEYARKSSGARLALLFSLNKESQMLMLLERCGKGPHHFSSSDSERNAEQLATSKPGFPYTSSKRGLLLSDEESPDKTPIPLYGLFGSVLLMQGLVDIPDIYSDPRSLAEERLWAWRGGHAILSAIGVGGQAGDAQGVLVLCFGPDDKEWQTSGVRTATSEGNLLICTTLLLAYLSEESVAALISRNQELRIAEQQAAIDQERSRIAHDIHDGAAQNVAHVIHKLEFVQRVLEKQPQVALREVGRARDILEESLSDLRHGISSLIPIQLEEQGFDAAVQALLENYALNEPGLEISYDIDDPTLLPPSLEPSVFHFIQEALNNVRKHAQASSVAIRIPMLPGLLVVEVSDNGVGFDVEGVLSSTASGAGQHIGLRTMRERIRQAGGQWEISSKPGAGTIVKAHFSLATSPSALTGREREVLRLLIDGLTNRAIAAKLSISIETVKSHVHHIMQKMQVKDRTQAAVIATKQRWL